jgi:hypothetical protein
MKASLTGWPARAVSRRRAAKNASRLRFQLSLDGGFGIDREHASRRARHRKGRASEDADLEIGVGAERLVQAVQPLFVARSRHLQPRDSQMRRQAIAVEAQGRPVLGRRLLVVATEAMGLAEGGVDRRPAPSLSNRLVRQEEPGGGAVDRRRPCQARDIPGHAPDATRDPSLSDGFVSHGPST